MSITIKLKSLLNEIILEVGDIENIKPYSFIKISNESYKFITEDGEEVKVIFFKAPLSVLGIEDQTTESFINVGYTLSGSETQLKKSTYSYLIKILKTVIDIITDYLKIHQTKYLFISATNKSDEKSMAEFDSQKNKLYQAILLKNINKLPKYDGKWKYKILNNVLNVKGDSILLYNEK